jgi:hypothetical protein
MLLPLRPFWLLTGTLWAFAAATLALDPVSAQPAIAAVTRIAQNPAPDLAPIPTRLQYGVVSVRNMGPAISAPSVVTIECNKTGRQGGCPEPPRQYRGQYSNPAFPNRLAVSVPALQPGHVYNHALPFWAGLAWPTGAYEFDFVADAGASNAESNEGNNAGSWMKVAP